MRISELFENASFDENKFIKNNKEKQELDFDLVDDLIFFVNHDDEIFRKYTYAAIEKLKLVGKKERSPSIFKDTIKNGYEKYIKLYPICSLSNKIKDDVLKKACRTMYDTILQQVISGEQ